jgi:hypothetical protein
LSIAAIPGWWIPAQTRSKKTLLYLHGSAVAAFSEKSVGHKIFLISIVLLSSGFTFFLVRFYREQRL